jgi:sulfite reductase alpha subunit-like flavoprotein
MVGAGTGIAPFRSFWQKRKQDMENESVPSGQNKGWGEMVIYFGCRQCRIDELYRSEIDNLLRKKIVTSYYGAYSREPNFKKV